MHNKTDIAYGIIDIDQQIPFIAIFFYMLVIGVPAFSRCSEMI